jgi:hypothetical protein
MLSDPESTIKASGPEGNSRLSLGDVIGWPKGMTASFDTGTPSALLDVNGAVPDEPHAERRRARLIIAAASPLTRLTISFLMILAGEEISSPRNR